MIRTHVFFSGGEVVAVSPISSLGLFGHGISRGAMGRGGGLSHFFALKALRASKLGYPGLIQG